MSLAPPYKFDSAAGRITRRQFGKKLKGLAALAAFQPLAALARRGHSAAVIEKVIGANFYRVLGKIRGTS